MTTEQNSAPDEESIAREWESRVQAYAAAALDSLPEQYASKVQNVRFFVQRGLTRDDRERINKPRGELYGLYEGIPLTHRGSGYSHVTPDRITIYWGPLVRDFADDGALEDKVKKVVYHEIGHYFGLSEADLSHTSVH